MAQASGGAWAVSAWWRVFVAVCLLSTLVFGPACGGDDSGSEKTERRTVKDDSSAKDDQEPDQRDDSDTRMDDEQDRQRDEDPADSRRTGSLSGKEVLITSMGRQVADAIRDVTDELVDLYEEEDAEVTVSRFDQWSDFYEDYEDYDGPRFHRVIFVGRGGWNGPMAEPELLEQDVQTIESGGGLSDRLQYSYQRQPETTIDLEASYIALLNLDMHLQLLVERNNLPENPAIAMQRLGALNDLQVDSVLFDRCEGEALRDCEDQCQELLCSTARAADIDDCADSCVRDVFIEARCVASALIDGSGLPTFSVDVEESELDGGFDRLADTLAAMTEEDGVIYLAHSNAGSARFPGTSREFPESRRDAEMVTGESFVERLAEASERHVAGPIGSLPICDLVEGIKDLEDDRIREGDVRDIKPDAHADSASN